MKRLRTTVMGLSFLAVSATIAVCKAGPRAESSPGNVDRTGRDALLFDGRDY